MMVDKETINEIRMVAHVQLIHYQECLKNGFSKKEALELTMKFTEALINIAANLNHECKLKKFIKGNDSK